MGAASTYKATSANQVLERLSIGEPIQNVRVEGLLDLDPLVVSRWLCGEDMRGIYQPVSLRECILGELDLEGRTFYETVELIACRVAVAHFKQAYFYSNLLVEDCIFEEGFDGQGIQSDGRLIIHNTVFVGWAGFASLSLRGRVDLVDVSFLGGTDLLHVLADGARAQLGHEIHFSGCRFRTEDVPAGLDTAQLGILPLGESDLAGAEGERR